MNTLRKFYAISEKDDKYGDFLYALLQTNALLKCGLLDRLQFQIPQK